MLDELDRKILTELMDDARLSHRRLSARVGSTGPTVAARIRRLEDAGIIQGYTVRLDPHAFPGPQEKPDLSVAAVACHWCRQRTTEPKWLRIDGRDHPFCCPNCKKSYAKRHAELLLKNRSS